MKGGGVWSGCKLYLVVVMLIMCAVCLFVHILHTLYANLHAHSHTHTPTADRFRVLLKGEHPDYINAVFAHVSTIQQRA